MIVFPNIRDGFFVGVGMVESVVRLMLWRPDVVFTKGGFVCLPIGMAAHLLRIPLVIHDSDAHPGLTNRVLAKWATSIATGAPLKFYPYPLSRSHYVGVPVANEFAQPLNDEQRRTAKVSLGFDPSRPLIVITGGGLGAKRLNDATMEILPALLEQTNVLLVSGDGQYDELASSPLIGDARFQLHAFVSQGMATMLGAADLVVARAGATTILELAGLAKPTILVPNAFLTGGHQLKNAAVYAEKGAVSVVTEEDIEKSPTILLDEIFNILSDHDRAASMGHAFRQFAKPDAAKEVAKLVINAVKRK